MGDPRSKPVPRVVRVHAIAHRVRSCTGWIAGSSQEPTLWAIRAVNRLRAGSCVTPLARPACFCQAGGMRDMTVRTARDDRKTCGVRAAMPGLALAMAGAMAAGPIPARADTWRFDPVHSQVWFTASHQGFSHPQGRVRIAQGWFRFDPDDWPSAAVDVVLDLASADLGEQGWNKALRSPALLDAGRRPTARYTGHKVERTGERSGVIHGELELRGRRVPVDVAFTLNRIGNDPYAFGRKAGFSASARLARADFGIDRYEEVIGATIDLRLEIEGIADRDAAPQSTNREDRDGDQE